MARKPELYEILAQKKAQGVQEQPTPTENPVVPAAPVTTPEPRAVRERPKRAPREGRDLVFSVETGFVLFVAVLIVIGSAYMLGVEKGRNEAKNAFAEGPKRQKIEKTGIKPAQRIEGQPRQGAGVRLQPNAWTLRLRLTSKGESETEMLRLRQDRTFALQQAPVRERNQDAFVFYNRQQGLHFVGVGVFESKNDPALKALRDYFSKAQGPETSQTDRPYKNCAAELIGNMGEVIVP